MKTQCLLVILAIFSLASCDPNQGDPPDIRLEKTAHELEAKADLIREEVGQVAEQKDKDAEIILETKGNEKAAELLKKDAETTREAGETRAEQLEKQAQELEKKAEKLREESEKSEEND
ncbi:MAG: hypothetical protein ACSHX7_09720 [Luteolibacter sp.]